MNDTTSPDLLELTANIVSSFVGHNSVSQNDLAALIASVHGALAKPSQPVVEPAPLVPAVAIKKSVTPDYIISLEDGKKFKSMKRYLRTSHDMSPDDYRQKWGLPADYPMVAPNYAAARSNLAKTMGLGQKRKLAAGRVAASKATPAPTVTGKATKRK